MSVAVFSAFFFLVKHFFTNKYPISDIAMIDEPMAIPIIRNLVLLSSMLLSNPKSLNAESDVSSSALPVWELFLLFEFFVFLSEAELLFEELLFSSLLFPICIFADEQLPTSIKFALLSTQSFAEKSTKQLPELIALKVMLKIVSPLLIFLPSAHR